MMKVTKRSCAKLNLTFDILGILPDGYHEVETLMQTVSVFDELSFELQAAAEFSVTLQTKNKASEFPLDDTNLIVKAAKSLLDDIPQLSSYKVKVGIDKQIPIAAGLAGGSGNAAAALLAINELFGNLLTLSQLIEKGSRLGADVPFCLIGGTAIGRGKGDLITSIKTNLPLKFCLVKPRNVSLSTPWVYSQFDQREGDDSKRPNLKQAIAALEEANLESAIDAFGNVFEPVVYEKYPQLLELKQKLYDLGCPYVQLTGSGPTIFSIVTDLEMAHFVRSKFVAQMPSDEFSFFICDTVDASLVGTA